MHYDPELRRMVDPYYIWQCDECNFELDEDGNCPYCYEEDEDE